MASYPSENSLVVNATHQILTRIRGPYNQTTAIAPTRYQEHQAGGGYDVEILLAMRLLFQYKASKAESNRGVRFKIGYGGSRGWIAAIQDNVGFLKPYDYGEDSTCPDRGSAVEIYTDQDVLEIETLGPLATIEPDGELEHTVNWEVIDRIDTSDRSSQLTKIAK